MLLYKSFYQDYREKYHQNFIMGKPTYNQMCKSFVYEIVYLPTTEDLKNNKL